jgi:hypothetical protein
VVVYGEVGLTVAVVILQLATTVLMYRKSALFRRFFLFQWLAIPAMFLLDILLISMAMNMPANQIMTGEFVGQTLGAFAVTGLWVWYVFKSVRVRNTFGEKPQLAQIFA